ncbi:alveolar macrophage chemotactic factor-like [Hyla sarda]|uniref:alveolar macrophage chemotactic factor-like n=1 Tax=Hyla sarda TaxID=327740 RepID=UPI0024C38CCF|nr:alveolar macrophage chemotactic factor-like [Hyla sarda]
MQCKIPSSSAIFLQLSVMLYICIGVTRAADLRCQCINTTRVLKPIDKTQVMNVEIINSGPYCSRVEVIITLKNGRKDCLNPEVKWVKHMINNVLVKKGIKTRVKLQRKN